MKTRLIHAVASAAVLGVGAAAAEGDPAAGEAAFRKCSACHMIADGDNLIARGGQVGPNLYGVAGRQAGGVESYRYGDSIVAAGAAGLVWNEEDFTGYVADPSGFLKEYLDDTRARAKMSFRLRQGAADVWAYLESVGPEASQN